LVERKEFAKMSIVQKPSKRLKATIPRERVEPMHPKQRPNEYFSNEKPSDWNKQAELWKFKQKRE
jgi:hypothetical protein